MKKAILTLVVVAMVSATAVSKTNTSEKKVSSKITLSSIENARFSLNMATEEKGTIKLKITDKNGKLLISENVNYNKSFSLPIDMTSLDEGIYLVSADSPDASLQQEIFISKLYNDDVAAFLSESANGKYQLKVFHENVPVSIKIVDSDGNIYYENTVKSTDNFIQNFDLSSIKNLESLEMVISGIKTRIYKTL